MGNAKKIAITAAVALCLIVLFQNTDVVSFRFLFWTVSMSRIIFLPLLVFIGFLIGFIMGKNTQY